MSSALTRVDQTLCQKVEGGPLVLGGKGGQLGLLSVTLLNVVRFILLGYFFLLLLM